MSKRAAADQKGIRVLIAGENNPLLADNSSLFPAGEYDIFIARDGCQAYSLAKQILPAIIFLERAMPVLDGEECCRLIKGETRLRGASVVLVAEDAERRFQQARGTSADLVICKPSNQKNFLNLLRSLLENSGEHAPDTAQPDMFIELPTISKT